LEFPKKKIKKKFKKGGGGGGGVSSIEKTICYSEFDNTEAAPAYIT